MALFATYKAQKYNDRVASAEKKAIATANERAALADERAALADERGKRLEVEAQKMRKENLQLQSRVEQERTGRLQLEDKIAPRWINPGQWQYFGSNRDRLKGYNIEVILLSDAEAHRYGKEIARGLEVGGASVVARAVSVYLPPPLGIIVQHGYLEKPAGESVASFLREAGLNVAIQAFPLNEQPGLKVLVGLKPPEAAPVVVSK